MSTNRFSVGVIHAAEQIEGIRGDWDRLAGGVPFRRWDWLGSWWSHYRQPDWKLCVAVVRDEQGILRGIAPWYVERSMGQGPVIRFLGSGKACTDYATVLCSEEMRRTVGAALWKWLTSAMSTNAAGDGPPAWDLLELEGVVEDPTMDEFVRQGRAFCSHVLGRELEHCWRIRVPHNWDSYVAMLSPKYRTKVRSLCKKYLDAGQVDFQTAQNASQRNEFAENLIDLHQRRRNSLGGEGCFACPRFSGFLRDFLESFGQRQELVLGRVKVRGQVAGVAVAVTGAETLYQYQCGMEPELRADNPGWLLNLLMIRECQRRGIANFDLMRGDEPYKSHLGAEPKTCHRWRFVPRRTIPQIRYHVWEVGAQLRDWAQTTWSSVAHG